MKEMTIRLMALLLLTMPVAAQAKASYTACKERASIDSTQYPQRVDKDTTITGVSCREAEGRVIYVYDNKLDSPRSRLVKNAMKKQAVAIRSMLCTNPSLTALLKLVDMEYTFYDSENVFIGTITNRIEDCH